MLELEPDAPWSQEGPTLSNDIWKKFGLITPPRSPPCSPLRDTDFDLGSIPDDLPMDLSLLEGDELDVDLDSIDLESFLPELSSPIPPAPEATITCSHGVIGTCPTCTKLALVGSELRHDCMWQGTCTAEAHAHHHPRTHKDSCSHITELLMDSSGALEGAAGFTHLADLHHDDGDDDDSDSQMDGVTDDLHSHLPHHVPRPDTPSESSETDTDEDNDHGDDDDDDDDEDDDRENYGVCHEEEVVTSEETPNAALGIVHIDHSYYCPRIPSPEPAAPVVPTIRRHLPSSSLLHTPSDSEDEIDVVSVGSSSSGYSTASSGSSSSKSSSSKQSGATSTNSSKKVVKIRTGSLPANPSRRMRKQLQHAMAAGVKRRGGNTATLLRRTGDTHKTPKRLHGRGALGRKRNSPRSESDDPEKRHLHNSLERMRRVDLRNAFEELRARVPDLQEREKAPKVEILKKASDFCVDVFRREQRLIAEKERLRRYQSELRRRIHTLQSQH